MSTPDDRLSGLIERLEKSSGPDDGLNDEIYWAVGEWINEGGWWRRHKVTGHRERYTYHPAPDFTGSIDVAMKLVPEGAHWTLEPDAAWVRWITADDVDEVQGSLPRRDGKCTAIALCIAALRAKSRSPQP